jgi:hypothetical protein
MNKVYILKNAEGVVKIGYTGQAAEARRSQCSHAMCTEFSVVAYFDNPKTPARALEKMAHNLCSNYRIATKDCFGNNCYEYYKLPDEVLAFVILYLGEASAQKLDYHEFGRSVPFKSQTRKVLQGIKKINNAIDEGYVLRSGRNHSALVVGLSYLKDCYLPTYSKQGISNSTAHANHVANDCILRFNSKGLVTRVDVQVMGLSWGDEIDSSTLHQTEKIKQRMKVRMTKKKQKAMPNFVEA